MKGLRRNHSLQRKQQDVVSCHSLTSRPAAPERVKAVHSSCARVSVLKELRPPARKLCIARSPAWQCTVKCQASAAGDAAAPTPRADSGLGSTLVLGALFGGWYLANIYFNIYNKQVLKAFPFPITCTVLQFAVGATWCLVMWTVGLHSKPKLDGDTIKTVLPLAVVHTLGNLLTNISLGQVAVSFTHTIKAMEPFFSVVLSALFLGDVPSLAVVLTLFPIVGGVACASLSEASFTWPGFISAMGSNITFQSRNVLSKKFMAKGKGSLDNINLFSVITIMSFFLLAPVAVFTEGVKFTPTAMKSMGIIDPSAIMKKALLTGAFFHMYQQVSYMILQRVSPVTHSIGNCVKRVIVIVAAVVVFQNPMSQQNKIGTAIALAGVFAYSQIKRFSGKKVGTGKAE